ncbi:hypothetical protein L9F63_016619 [Diploptera punctata]|uniref:CHK kinase-like domain-containing protein n=1 Tax=Diploptera punctata TaxID=6984 RepID=A0AAD8A0R6_DIPPU|nr:hypothetical protein L9F63_016619 [Diploptera punctata]
MEDLKREGFTLVNGSLGLDLKHCQLVLRKIAGYHAASVVLHEKNPKCFNNFLDNVYSTDCLDDFGPVIRTIFKNCVDMISKWPGYGTYVDTLRSLEDTIVSHIRKANERDEAMYNVLNHGDLWINNIMFKYNEQKQEVEDVR